MAAAAAAVLVQNKLQRRWKMMSAGLNMNFTRV